MASSEHGELRSAIEETSKYFTSLLELVPAKFYIGDAEDASKYQYERKKKKTQLNKKLLAKKAKLLKLDPASHKSITELQLEIEQKEKELFKKDQKDGSYAVPIKVSECPSASLDELRERLHAKLSNLRGKRKILSGDDKIEAKHARLERKESKSKQKKKEKVTENIKRVAEISNKASGAVRNDNGDIVFSKFDFATEVDLGKHEKKKKKDLGKLLNKAEKRQEKLKKLKAVDPESAKKMLSDGQWEAALKKAGGEKLKDDPKLIKKAIKRKEKQKERSKKKWDDRKDTVNKHKADKQKKRKENIKERKTDKLNKKLGLAKKTNASKQKSKPKRQRPGF